MKRSLQILCASKLPQREKGPLQNKRNVLPFLLQQPVIVPGACGRERTHGTGNIPYLIWPEPLSDVIS